jgi:RimK-like ATP-grasp domain
MNIFLYYARPIKLSVDGMPFKESFKIPTYTHLFNSLTAQGASVYLASFEGNYMSDCLFKDPFFFDGTRFVKKTGTFQADLILDRSFAEHLPPAPLLQKMYNSFSFKALCANKEETYRVLSRFMPKSITTHSLEELLQTFKQFENEKMVVLKPAFGIKGNGVLIDNPKNLLKILPQERYPYIIQKFVDTSFGIENITSGIHDLRFVVVNGKVILAAIRKPVDGSLLANVSQGGSIEEVPLDKIPKNILNTTLQVFESIEKEFPGSCYSMDFGIENGAPYLFEVNDRIGLPRPEMPSAFRFSEELANKLIALAHKN